MTAPDFEEAVEIVAYTPAWLRLFAEEAIILRYVFADRVQALEHFGSTSVAGLAAKPIIDILIGVAELIATPTEISAMARHGYEAMGAGAVPGRLHFRKRVDVGANVNANLVVYEGQLWRDNLALRDYLRRNATQARRYEAVKRAAAAAHPDSLLAYAEAKAGIIAELLQAALRHSGQP